MQLYFIDHQYLKSLKMFGFDRTPSTPQKHRHYWFRLDRVNNPENKKRGIHFKLEGN